MENEPTRTGLRTDAELSKAERYWLKHYQGCQTAGKSMAAYAREHGLAVKSFYYWKRRLRELDAIAPEPPPPFPVFHQVRIERPPVVETTCRLRFPNGMECELTELDEPGLERLLMTISRLSQ